MPKRRRAAGVLRSWTLERLETSSHILVNSSNLTSAMPLTSTGEPSVTTHDSTASITRVANNVGALTADQTSAELNLSATTRVLQTTELLEKILAEVPNQQLLLRQHTCKNFRDTIRGSLFLQRKLYLAPAGSGWGSVTPNPLWDAISTHRVPRLEVGRAIGNMGTIREDFEVCYTFRYKSKYYALGRIRPQLSPGDEVLSIMVATHTETRSAVVVNISSTSFSDMYVCQPPKSVTVHLYGGARESDHGKALIPLIGVFTSRSSIGGIFEKVSQIEKRN